MSKSRQKFQMQFSPSLRPQRSQNIFPSTQELDLIEEQVRRDKNGGRRYRRGVDPRGKNRSFYYDD